MFANNHDTTMKKIVVLNMAISLRELGIDDLDKERIIRYVRKGVMK